MGATWDDPRAQAKHWFNEQDGSENRWGLKAAQTPEDANRAVVSSLRPAGWTARNPQGGHNYDGRLNFTQEAFRQLSEDGTGPVTLRLPDGHTVRHGEEVVTFVNRNLEPYRGYHQFMRALPRILGERPEAHAVIVGGDGHSYGGAPPGEASWKDQFLDEVRDALPLDRVHVTGRLPYPDFLALMQISAAHVYLTAVGA